MKDSEYLTLGDVGPGYSYLTRPTIPSADATSGAKSKSTFGCMQVINDTPDSKLRTVVSAGYEALTDKKSYTAFVEVVFHMRDVSDVRPLATFMIRKLAACKNPKVRLPGVGPELNKISGGPAVTSCDGAEIFTDLASRRRPDDSQSINLLNVATYLVGYSNRFAYVQYYGPLLNDDSNPIGQAEEAKAICNRLKS